MPLPVNGFAKKAALGKGRLHMIWCRSEEQEYIATR